ncbi:methylmalonyl-CoA mutase family protein [Micromonospora sp. WMMA1363]|uniref:methylmalonyl-CoA mutase family protein n=1 Tax=Micromonospora sp. WMMA1363 TaxID=3053985 RepID=UPI00259C9BC6|nr:methylmalonyl-CoA mutase family protein [Micromonospora sp. WMMA1363]MDM4719558.1 methylmalonyl-CoA mutase family protein [Micromonospora sp. WMMA1363]
MTVPSETLRLAADFPAATHEQWRRLTLGVLRKAGLADEDTPTETVEELLTHRGYDDVELAPLYTADDPTPFPGPPGLFPYTRGGRATGAVVAGWDVRQRHADPDLTATGAAVRADLENGATSLWLVLGEGGVSPAGLPAVLEGVYLDLAGVVLDAGAAAVEVVPGWFALVADRGVPAAEVRGCLGVDPLGFRARTGQRWDGPAGEWARRCAAGFPGLRAMMVDATGYHDAGGSDAQEIGCALATGVAYLRELTAAGLAVPAAFGQLEFRYAATADQFATIAKLRAARRLWARVAQVCGVPEAGAQRQHAVTATAMMTARDPWVNMLRTTLACFAAGVGGADAVTVQPFDHCLGLPDGFARRIARNTQSLLLEEANVGRVVDPAGGSWYVERYTEELARVAWAWFTEIERAGGMGAALDSGLVADRLAATWQRRMRNLAHRRDPLTGVSEFPDLEERLPIRPPAPAAPGGGLPRHRYAEPYEALRDRSDAHTVATGARPTVFLATLGPAAAHNARAGFAANLFAAGGIATVRPPVGDDDPARLAAEFAASGARVACLCSSDRGYAESAESVARALADAGAVRLWLAGGPAGHTGVTDYLYAGCDAVAVLETTLRDLGVA